MPRRAAAKISKFFFLFIIVLARYGRDGRGGLLLKNNVKTTRYGNK